MMRENIVVRDDIRADIVEALQPVNARLDSVDVKTTQALNETKALHERLQTQEAGRALDVTRMSGLEEQVTEIKRQLSSGVSASAVGRPGRDPHDPAYCRVAFTNFPENLDVKAMAAAMKGFMESKCKDERYVYIDIFPNGKTGDPTNNGFVHFSTPKLASRVAEYVKKHGLKVQGFPDVTIKPALCEIDRNRNWALREAERLVKSSMQASGKNVTVKRAQGRGVYVDNEAAFTQQPRYARDGQFVGEFSDLSLR